MGPADILHWSATQLSAYPMEGIAERDEFLAQIQLRSKTYASVMWDSEKRLARLLPHLQRNGKPLLLLGLSAFLLNPAMTLAETAATSAWNISADKITRLENPQRIIAEGNIVLVKKEQEFPQVKDKRAIERSMWADLLEEKGAPPPSPTTDTPPEEKPEPKFITQAVIKADFINYNIEQQIIEARGNVSIESGEDRLSAQTAEIDLANETGSLDEAIITIEDIELYLEGRRIEKTGLKTYRIQDGWVITCKLEEGETAPWSFSSADTTFELEGYATLKHAKFNIRDVPVLYFPYLVVPVKNTRQTGLLIPEVSTSDRDGFGISAPFFINISDSSDITLFPEYLDRRGFMPGAEFRYVIDAQSKGRFMGSYLDDRLSDPSETAYYAETGFTHTNSDRYWVRGKVDQDISDTIVLRLDADYVSDQDYLEEFNSGITSFDESQKSFLESFGRGFENRNDDQRENSLQLLKTFNGSSLNLEILAINDAREVETDPSPLFKLPSLAYAGALPIAKSGFTLDWDADYVNFWREDGVGGHRVDIFPRLSSPLPLGPYLETRAEIGGRATFYAVETHGDAEWDLDENPDRFIPTFETEVATTLQRDFSLNTEGYEQLTHSFRPFVGYTYIPNEDQEDLPSFDSVDRIEETNSLIYGFDTFFDLFDKQNRYDRRYGFIRAEQSYNLLDEFSSEPFSPITLKLGWYPLRSMSLTYDTEIPIEDGDNVTHGVAGSYVNSRGDKISVDYRYNDDEEIEQINGFIGVKLFPKLLTSFNLEHSLAESETNEATISLTYLAQCWSVQLETKSTPTEERIMLVVNLANIGAPIELSF